AYGDLDGDGIEEAVVHVTCTYGANGAEDTIDVYALEGDTPVIAATIDEPPDSLDSELPPAVQAAEVVGDQVVVTWSHYQEGDPRCCPSGQAQVPYALEDGELVAGEPEVTPAS